MIRIINIILIFSFVHSIGLDALLIPSNSTQNSLSGSGVASQNLIGINPSVNYDLESRVGFSTNSWIMDIKGNSFYYSERGYLINFISFGVDEIEVRNESPSDEPLDLIGSRIYCLSFSKSHQFSNNFSLGFATQFNYNQLFTDKTTSFSYNFGARKAVSENIQIGLAVKNLNMSDYEFPITYIFGISYMNQNFNSEILFDYQYSSLYDGGLNFGLIQGLGIFNINVGYSKFSDLRTTVSSGIEITFNNKYKFIYSILSISESNFDLVHSIGVELSL